MKQVGDTKDFDSYQANTIKRNFNEWTTSIEGKNQSWLTYPQMSISHSQIQGGRQSRKQKEKIKSWLPTKILNTKKILHNQQKMKDTGGTKIRKEKIIVGQLQKFTNKIGDTENFDKYQGNESRSAERGNQSWLCYPLSQSKGATDYADTE